MTTLAQLNSERIWLEAELLAIQRAIDDQQRHPLPEFDAQSEVLRLLTLSLQECRARLRIVNAELAELAELRGLPAAKRFLTHGGGGGHNLPNF